jgi:hypothetical protein
MRFDRRSSSLERGAHLPPESPEEAVVQRGEGVARLAHQDERARHLLAPRDRHDGRIGKVPLRAVRHLRVP